MTEPDKQHVCPECGGQLPADSPLQPCPACMMKLGLDSWTSRQGSDAAAPQATDAVHQPFVPPTAEFLSERLPNLEVLQLLGQGGMGAVYQARQQSLDRIVAVKLIRPDAAEIDGFAERFTREARAMARLNHPNIVMVHDFGEFENLYFLVMEFVEGKNLRQLIEEGDLSAQEALGIVPRICEALQYAHEEGIVHRDIKPENILLDTKGRVKIADFGLAKLVAKESENFTLTATHQVMGTPRYMAPEQMEGSHEVDHRADIYSLGVVFYEMLTGQVPAGHFEPPSKKVEVDVRLDEIVLRSLARDPQRRYQQASDVKTDIDGIKDDRSKPAALHGGAAGTGDADQSHDPKSFRWGLFLSLLLVVLLGHGLIGFTMFWTTSSWALAGLGAIWVILGATSTYQENESGESATTANLLIALVIGIGLVAYGVGLAESSLPLLWVLPCFVAGGGGGALGTVIKEEVEKEKNPPKEQDAKEDGTTRTIVQYLLFFAILIGGSWLISEMMKPDPQVTRINEAPSATLLEAAATGDTEQIKGLLDDGADVDGQDGDGQSALMKAAAAGHLNACKMLVLRGADPQQRDSAGRTAMMHAAEVGRSQFLKELIEVEPWQSPDGSILPSAFFYPAEMEPQEDRQPTSVPEYLDSKGCHEAATALREQLQTMIAECTKIIEETEDAKEAEAALGQRAMFYHELGEVAKAEADEELAESSRKLSGK